MQAGEEKVNENPTDTYATFVCIFVAIGASFFGYEQGVSGGLIIMPSFLHDFCEGWAVNPENSDECHADSDDLPAKWGTFLTEYNTIYYLGCAAGAFGANYLSDWRGRRDTIFCCAIVFIASVIWFICSSDHTSLLVSRWFIGMGVGAASFILPLYNAEAAPTSKRGALTGVFQVLIVVGLVFAGIMNLVFESDEENGWRYSFGISLVPPVIIIFGIYLVPESPRWLFQWKGREEAEKSLARLRDNGPIQEELNEIEDEIRRSGADPANPKKMDCSDDCSTWAEALGPKNRKRVFIAMGLQLCQQITGINAVFVYGGIIFKDVIYTGDDTTKSGRAGLIALVILQSVNCVMTIPSLFIIDRLGRRFLLLAGSVWMCVFNLICGAIAATCDSDEDGNLECTSAQGWSMVAMCCLYITGFALSWGPVVWVYQAEIFPLKVRSKSVALGTTTNWLIGTVIQFVELLLPYIHVYGFFFLWCGTCALGGVFAYFFCPETMGVPLEEMDRVFDPKGAKKTETTTTDEAAGLVKTS